jgi:hypothetical protein
MPSKRATIDAAADSTQAEEMRTKAGGTWITPTVVIGEEVGPGGSGT